MRSRRQLPMEPLWGGVATTLWALGCGSLPTPPPIAPPEADFVEVPAPPPPARVEILPPRPRGARYWVDGSWMWEGSRWKWSAGGWFGPGIEYVDWRLKRREDGTLLYANAMWLGAAGAPVAAPTPLLRSPAIGGSSEEKPPPMGEGADQRPPPAGQPTERPNPGQVLGSENANESAPPKAEKPP